ncbi:MAG TPA: hypothetical protein VNZ48_10145 [Xanthobacteraceae bacterium]|jgi:hypothetical protein|nr:hypothetical protein [Xanthobacteraceae bacterium]
MTTTASDYQVGAAALAVVISAAIKANVPEFLQSDVPAGLVQQIEQQGAKAVIDAVDAHRAKQDAAKGMD